LATYLEEQEHEMKVKAAPEFRQSEVSGSSDAGRSPGSSNGGQAPTRTRWANPRFRVLVVGVGAVLALAVLLALTYYHNRQSTDDAQVDGHIVMLAPKVSGNVAEVLVSDNQVVKAGEVLVKIDPRDYQARLDQAQATLSLAKSQADAAQVTVPWTRDTTTNGTSAAEAAVAAVQADAERAKVAYDEAAGADLAYAQANVDAAQADSEKAQADLARMKPLVDKAEISQQQYDAYRAAARVAASQLQAGHERWVAAQKGADVAKATLVAAQAHVEQAQAALRLARANHQEVDISSARAASAQAGVAQAQANLEAAELDLSYTALTSPIDGVISKKSVEVGQVVEAGQALVVVVPLREIWVTANFKETQLAKVRPGQKAEVKVDTYGRIFSGHVDSISGSTGARLSLLPPENATGNFVKVVQRIPLKIVLDPIPPDQAVLRPGMNVDATIVTE